MMIVNISEHNNLVSTSRPTNFEAVWEHCINSGFLYPAKLKHLDASYSDLYNHWSGLVTATPEVFQFYPGYDDQKISGSVSAFRDTEQMYVVQQAAGNQQPMKMLRCMVAAIETLQSLPDAKYLSFYFRPDAAWSNLVVNEVNRVYPRGLVSSLTRHYLICWPHETPVDQTVQDRVEVLTDESSAELNSFVRAVTDPIRAASLGLGQHPYDLSTVNQNYSELGLSRGRTILGIHRDNQLAGVALCYYSNTLMNFNYLCNRAEIFVHPDAPDRTHVIYDLASAVICDAAQRGKLVCPLLIDTLDMPLTIGTGFQFTSKRFTNIIWKRDSKHGWSAISKAVENLYQLKLAEFAEYLLPN